jgi:GntR family transcriptional regulator / MocR family aminotransferase
MAKVSTATAFAAVLLDESSSVPLYRQLYHRLRTAILMGQLRPGTHLPSTREMAKELRVSRNTVMNAFEQLQAEGYVESQIGSGTFVSRMLPEDLLEARVKKTNISLVNPESRTVSQRGKLFAQTRVTVAERVGKMRPFIPGVPALDELPIAVWSRLMAQRWRQLPRDLLNYGAAAGYWPLREAIAAYLGPSRGVRCKPDQIIIVSGAQQAIDLAARILIDDGDSVLVEEFCYSAARAALLSAGARLGPVPVDESGLNISAAAAKSVSARIAYVTPSHQYPLGVTMSLSRRLALLDWATRAQAWILEDDYDSEYRYTKRPLAALQGLDRHGRVIYIGTFSKVLFPALRIGFVVAPPDLVDAFASARATLGWCSPVLDQAVLADFISQGHFTRHIRRMRTIYGERQAALIDALIRAAGDLLEITPADAGIHLRCALPDHLDDQAVSREALGLGVVAHPLSAFRVDESVAPRSGLILGYGAYNVRQIKEAASKLAIALSNISRVAGTSQNRRRASR